MRLELCNGHSFTKTSSSWSNSDSKLSTNKLTNVDNDGTINKIFSEKNDKDLLYVSFDGLKTNNTLKVSLAFLLHSIAGVSTVNDVLNRINEAVERSQIVTEDDNGKINPSIYRTFSLLKFSPADMEKMTKIHSNNENSQLENNTNNGEECKNEDEEPLRLNCSKMHNIEDFLLKLNNQAGNRKVIFENELDSSESAPVEKLTRFSAIISSSPIIPNESDDSSISAKNILKTCQNPSFIDTTTKITSFQNDLIHVNVESVQNANGLLSRIDHVGQRLPSSMNRKIQEKKRQGLFVVHHHS